MPPDPALVSVTQRLFYRYCSYDTPFWARESSRPGRWHATGDGPAQYLSATADGAWAELIRAEELRAEQEAETFSVSMWAVEVSCHMIADYSSFEKAQAAGFPPEALVDDSHERCRREGTRLRAQGCAGVLAPSAALPGETNLTLFGARIASAWGRPPLLASSLPATVIAKGAPPPGLLSRVRHLGTSHAGLEAFLRERPAR